jgi:hypothetical protein
MPGIPASHRDLLDGQFATLEVVPAVRKALAAAG